MALICPEGVGVGEAVVVTTTSPRAREVEAIVPEGVKPGGEFTIFVEEPAPPPSQPELRLEAEETNHESQKLFDKFDEKSAAFDQLAAKTADQVDQAPDTNSSPKVPPEPASPATLKTSPTPMLRVLAAVEAADTEATAESTTQQVAPISTEDALVAADRALKALEDMPLSDRYGMIATPLEGAAESEGKSEAALAAEAEADAAAQIAVAQAEAAAEAKVAGVHAHADTASVEHRGDQARAPSTTKGDRVKVYSSSASMWLSGVVEQIDTETGEAEVRYTVEDGTSRLKWVDMSDDQQLVVDTSADDASADARVSMSKGDRVKVFSASVNDWLSGVVEEVNGEGEASVRYQAGDEDRLKWVDMSDEQQVVVVDA